MTALEYFDLYCSLGWNIVPAYPRTKVPAGRWSGRHRPGAARKRVASMHDCNLAILLGDIIDVEGDTSEANKFIDRLCGKTRHPVYMSNRSRHHIFLSPDRFLKVVKKDGIEIRGNGHISIVPPSVHPCGPVYEWEDGPFDAPPMPDALLEFYVANRPQKPRIDRRDCVSPICAACGKRFPTMRGRFALELQAFKKHGQRWECHRCRVVDIRAICRFLKR